MPGSQTAAEDALSDRAVFNRRVALAPLCLCLVAGLHLYRVATADQTPWKGGGFGMFSTVDSESARYLRCYLLGDDGTEFPLAIPNSLSKRAAELRAAPSLDGAKQLALRLARRRWSQPTASRMAEAQLWLTSAADRRLSFGEVISQARGDESSIAELPPGLYLAAEGVDASAPEQGGIEFRAVRVEVWKYRFDAEKCELRGSKLFDVDQPRAKISTQGGQP